MGRSQRPRPKYLGKKLLQVRKKLGISQAEMVTRLGLKSLHQAHISGFERGEREPPLPVLLKYARLVGVSTDCLIDDELELSEVPARQLKMQEEPSGKRRRKRK